MAMKRATRRLLCDPKCSFRRMMIIKVKHVACELADRQGKYLLGWEIVTVNPDRED